MLSPTAVRQWLESWLGLPAVLVRRSVFVVVCVPCLASGDPFADRAFRPSAGTGEVSSARHADRTVFVIRQEEEEDESSGLVKQAVGLPDLKSIRLTDLSHQICGLWGLLGEE